MNRMLEVKDLTKDYPLPEGVLHVFKGIDFEINKGDFVAIMGVSGVGKTTLLNLLGILDRPTRGKIFLEGEDVSRKSEKELAEIRNQKIGFVFQFYHLLPEFTSLENVSFPLLIKGVGREEAAKRSSDLLREVFLEEKIHIRPAQLSGGEQQRVAVARALANEPKLLLADEPTGNLDWKTGEQILQLIKDLHIRKKLTSVVVTHNEKVANFCDKVYLMEKGSLKLLSSK
ncbi:MAG: ATP-binding cassette domain-containing protein [Candidatus Aminicenantes bacterium]|nr:ATP-binding cassette domain-containing protein [Candidatus Aminicenantes bacterium]